MAQQPERNLGAELPCLLRFLKSPAPVRALVSPARKADLKSHVHTQNGVGGRHPRSFRQGKLWREDTRNTRCCRNALGNRRNALSLLESTGWDGPGAAAAETDRRTNQRQHRWCQHGLLAVAHSAPSFCPAWVKPGRGEAGGSLPRVTAQGKLLIHLLDWLRVAALRQRNAIEIFI